MKTIHVVDVTLREYSKRQDISMGFKEKLEIAKQMDKIKVDVVEVPHMGESASDSLLIRTIANTLTNAIVSCPVGIDTAEADKAWESIKNAHAPRLHVLVPTSTVAMEYTCRMKPVALIEAIKTQVAHCAGLCPDVEFSAEDATRSDIAFVCEVIETAITAGAKTITICDNASAMLPHEFSAFIKEICERVPATATVEMSVSCGNDLKMAAANSFAAIDNGITQIKTAMSSKTSTAIETITRAIQLKGVEMGLSCAVKNTELNRAMSQMRWISEAKTETSAFDSGVAAANIHGDIELDSTADVRSIAAVCARMGYELTDDDIAKVYDAFIRVVDKKQSIGAKEMEAIIASSAAQVPPTYILERFVVNSVSDQGATSHIVLEKNGKTVQGVCIGDGPVDASFLAIEQIIGRHYELDDFQIQSVTRGREAVGDALVKLRANGKLYSGKGISTDIVGATIHAYLNALNKIVFEETEI